VATVAEPFEFVALGDVGRRYAEEYLIRLGDADEQGQLRLDGAARFLQDVATDDWTDTGVASSDVWVVRRTTMRLVEGARWPRYLDRVTITTWCGGSGAAWAERRTNFDLDGAACLEVAALWVPTDPSGRPVRMREDFFAVYGEAARARKVPGRVSTPEIPDTAMSRPWPLRVADLDIIGHVNNAAIWQAISEVVAAPVTFVSVTHHQALERSDTVSLLSVPGALWLVVDGVVKVSAQYRKD
jgi:acyl-ACP thioesterase